MGGAELFIVLIVCLVLVPLPLFIVYKVGFNQGKRQGKLEAYEELNRQPR